jgi:hypothetical protein
VAIASEEAEKNCCVDGPLIVLPGVVTVQYDFQWYYRVFQKELYNGTPNDIVWRVLRKPLHFKAYKLFTVKYLELWIICTPLSVNIFVTLATQ